MTKRSLKHFFVGLADFCSIKVRFSIADMNMEQETDPDDPETALDDEEMYDDATPQRGGAQSKGAVTQGQTEDGNIQVAPEGSSAEQADGSDGEDADLPQGPAYPANVYVTVSKPGKGAMQIVTSAQDGVIVVDHVEYYPKAELAEAGTAESEFARNNIYAGPPFQNLDPELQDMLERYLDERGINEQLASFVPDYIDHKEQREYVRWLESK